jgi:hypothetical protein
MYLEFVIIFQNLMFQVTELTTLIIVLLEKPMGALLLKKHFLIFYKVFKTFSVYFIATDCPTKQFF